MVVSVRLRRSQVAGVAPVSLLVGEVALNEPDGNLFTRKADGSIRTTNLDNAQASAYVKPQQRYSLATNCSAAVTLAGVVNQIRVFPWIVSSKRTIISISTEITSALAGTFFRVGIYADNGSVYPGNLIAASDASLYDSGSVGVKSQILVAPFTLAPGLYWVAINSSNTPTFRAIPPTAIAPVLGCPATLGATPFNTGLSVAFAFGSMPLTFPTMGASFLVNTAAPLTVFQVA